MIAIVTCVLDAPVGVLTAAEILRGNHTSSLRTLGWLDALRPAGVVPYVVNAGPTSEEAGIEAAAAALTAAMQSARTGVPALVRHIVLPTNLIARESTAVPGALA